MRPPQMSLPVNKLFLVSSAFSFSAELKILLLV
jgi:hypothetical protein